ncbi:RNA recognition motif-containing protein [Niveomyces insectorum RCEF 264]|uniref:RNA recognition motif-containing protein n=1 Tax=Niveomyces insectorum RCEF 264 TaxID=1081102 RepID=A0A167UYS3_9HYPO|nr:RNA recognition motif-containing protein [Niveomyces insectorum RCEF 264]
MAARPGEEVVATLFGDVHYFYGPEDARPLHHRFDKGSYVYLFENAHEGRARIEIANRPGTDEQDAFDGFLDRTAVTYSYKHSCMVSLAIRADAAPPSPDEWHLPTYDPHNQAIYHYPLRSLDIYFWTPRDALQFVNGVRFVLPAHQLDIQDEPVAAPPPPPPQQQQHQRRPPAVAAAQNDLVQKLEHVAINHSHRSCRWTHIRRTTSLGRLGRGPPHDAIAAATAAPVPIMAYNPAAPPAPEAIRPREKTPPPEDTPAHDPLHQTLYQDANTPFSPGLVVPAGLGPLSPGVPPPAFQPPPGAPSFPGPPAYTGQPGPPGPPGHPGLIRAATLPPLNAPAPFNPAYPGSPPGFLPPPTAASVPPPPMPAAAAVAGFSHYSYKNEGATAAAAAAAAGGSTLTTTTTTTTNSSTPDFSVHQQLYRPTEGEASKHHTQAYRQKQDPRGMLEESAGRLERGVTGMLKKFEKRFG